MKHLNIVMSALKHAWKGDQGASATYIRFLAEKLKEDGEESGNRLLLEFLDVLEGRRAEVSFKPCDE
jgi:spore maturation protein CgeB